MMQCYMRGNIARNVHLGFRIDLAPLADAKFYFSLKAYFVLAVKSRRMGC